MPRPDDVHPDFNAPGSPRRFTQARPRPLSVWALFLILFIQGMTVVIQTVVGMMTSSAEVLDTVGQVMLLALYVLAGAVLILLGFRLFLGSAGARTPAMVCEFMVVVLSFGFFSSGLILIGALFAVPAAVALLLLFVAPTQNWLSDGAPQPDAGGPGSG